MGVIAQVIEPNQHDIIFAKEYITNKEWFDIFYKVDGLENYFQSQPIKKLISIVNQYYHTYNALPSMDDLATNHILDSPQLLSTINLAKYTINLDEFKNQTELYLKFNAMMDLFITENGKFNINNVGNINTNIDIFIDKMKKVQQFTVAKQTKITDGFESLDFMDDYLYNSVSPENILSTGYKMLDDELGGGFIRGTLNLFVAGLHVGKTLTKQNLAMNMAEQGHDVLYVPLEMSTPEMHRRLFARVLETPTVDINVDTWGEQKDQVTKWYNETVKGSIRFAEYSVKELTAVKLEALLQEYHKLYDKYPDALFIDSGNLMGSKLSGVNSHDLGEDIANDLKGIGQRYFTAVIVSNQLNRTGVQQSKTGIGVGVELIAGSIYWAQVADNVVILTVNADDESTMNVVIHKNRNTGKTQKVLFLKRDTAHQHIYDEIGYANIEHKIAHNINATRDETDTFLSTL